MLLSQFDFELPPELIAQEPLDKRDASRMLVLARKNGAVSHDSFSSFPAFFNSGDVLVVNNTKVFPARLYGETESGAKVEVFLVEMESDKLWSTLARPGKRLKVGKRIVFGPELSGEVVAKDDSGRVSIRFDCEGSFDDAVDKLGETPLPPYIKRIPGESDEDIERYQTLYASERGAIAAPTAGLHFTEAVFEQLRDRGVEIVEITLHVGYGTFEPVRVENLNEHSVSAEKFEISKESARLLTKAKCENRRITAVGTTTTRALESAIAEDGSFSWGKQTANLTITPGYRFKAVDALLTNFHLPKSSLMVLVSTFAGHENVMNAYRHAVKEGYRFYSYGDCMLII